MKKKRLLDFFKEQQADLALIQGRVPSKIRERAAELIRTDRAAGRKVTWDRLIEAMCLMYIAEHDELSKEKKN